MFSFVPISIATPVTAFRVLVTGFLLLLLSGCTVAPKTGVVLSDEVRQAFWENHKEHVYSLSSWQLTGRLGLKVPGESGALSMDWLQEKDKYRLYLDGPLGSSVAKITGTEAGVALEASGKRYLGRTAEALLLGVTGWDLPVSALRYWVMGVPVPDVDFTVKLDNQGYPAWISQQGWSVEYLGYKTFDGIRMPSRLKVSQGEVSAILVVRKRIIHSNIL